jgi:hypothetical protein
LTDLDLDKPISGRALLEGVQSLESTLGTDITTSLISSLIDRGIAFDGKNQYTLRRLSDELEVFFGEEGSSLLVNMVQKYLQDHHSNSLP